MNPCASFHMFCSFVCLSLSLSLVLSNSHRVPNGKWKPINFRWEWTDWNKLDAVQSVAKFKCSNGNGLSTHIFFHINFVFISIDAFLFLLFFFQILFRFENLFKWFQNEFNKFSDKMTTRSQDLIGFRAIVFPIMRCAICGPRRKWAFQFNVIEQEPLSTSPSPKILFHSVARLPFTLRANNY